MSDLPDDISLGDVMLPGTHQSTALYGFPISQCQQPSTPLSVQLQDGIRFLGSSELRSDAEDESPTSVLTYNPCRRRPAGREERQAHRLSRDPHPARQLWRPTRSGQDVPDGARVVA